GTVYPLKGTAVFAQRQIDESTGTLLIEAAFPNTGRVIRPGQFAKVRAVFEERKGATLIPARSVTELQGQFIVYAVTPENKAQFRKVTLGPKFGQLQVVEQGVNPGEKVIVEGIQKVRPDALVSPTLLSTPADTAGAQASTGGGN
ncbi:MAG TPA: efflux transporter periplasmic adaptor subunit, partial [Bacteroidota bacterium]|nr:efflux transporter periplasmic adaptor subunit [Bacteroidota bacterium]